ncbi:hypothetical protein V8G69_00425 [Gaetbulibacter sp. M235]|uniref:hypothetical protein n=1 Tax=Gaetbulibacter sp. M235 TaxID=3126510 RepID=UPI00374FCBC4
MKNKFIAHQIFLVVLSVFLCTSGFAQKAKKDKIRLKAEYVKIMNAEIYFDIKATSKVDNQNIDVSNIELTLYNNVVDDQIELGKTKTNMNGESKFILKDINAIKPDSTNIYNIEISFDGNDAFSRVSKTISFKNANIEAKLITKDSINYITATLIDKSTDSVVSDALLRVQVQRLFRPLRIGEEFNSTDETGTIIVPIEEGIPGVDGKLTFEVVLKDSDDFGTVKALVNAPIGVPIVEESTFDERTMWSPRNKTPLFLLIFPNLIILGIWGIIIYLILNLIKLKKS